MLSLPPFCEILNKDGFLSKRKFKLEISSYPPKSHYECSTSRIPVAKGMTEGERSIDFGHYRLWP
jgi:hypothetical protein